MKKHYIILGLFCLLAIVACSDNDPVVEVNNGNQTEEELPPLPTEVITGSRAMWVSYDPAPNVDANNSSGISSALISWRILLLGWMRILMYQKRMYTGSLLPIRLKRFAIIPLPLKWQKSFIMRLD